MWIEEMVAKFLYTCEHDAKNSVNIAKIAKMLAIASTSTKKTMRRRLGGGYEESNTSKLLWC